MILLDTHVVVWLAFDPNRLSRKARTAIDHAREAVDQIVGGEEWMDAISEFLDEFYPSGASERKIMIGEEPVLTGVAFQDAYVGAVG